MFSRRLWRVAGRKAAGVCLLLAAMLVVLLSLPAALGQSTTIAFAQPASAPFTDELWNDVQPIYNDILRHPFLLGLSDGTLPESRFEYYLVQDWHYLRAFSEVLKVLAEKAPRKDWAATLQQHATSTLEAERQLHDALLGSSGISSQQIENTPVSPTTYAYMNHLLVTAREESFARGLAGVLPCYWVYWEVGKELAKRGSKRPAYQSWIDQYADPEYGGAVEQVLTMFNAEAESLDPASRRKLKESFRTSTRYEWMFWDMAWREEKWQP